MTEDATAARTGLLDYTEEIESELTRILTVRALQATTYGAHIERLWETASQCILGGKLLRPRLLLGAFDAMRTGSDPGRRASAVRLAAAVEVLHYAFLLHDDVIDGDLFRRGQPNLIGRVLEDHRRITTEAHGCADDIAPINDRALHWAQTNAILMGDLLLAAVHQTFARETLPDEIHTRLLDILDDAVVDSVAGELVDVGLSDGVVTPTLQTVLSMSRLKTSSYSFVLPLRVAACLAGADPDVIHALEGIGAGLGVAFQLQDDLLSTFGRATEHGKDPFSDLREGKETAIIAYARMTSAWPEIASDFGRSDLTERTGEAMRARLIECGAERFIASLIDDELRSLRARIQSPENPLPRALQDMLAQLVALLEDRRA